MRNNCSSEVTWLRGLWGILICLYLGVAALTALSACNTQSANGPSATPWEEIAERGVIRCGVVSNPPSCIIDPTTGGVSGIAAEAFEEVAKRMDIEVEWTEEVGFGSMIEGLRTGRYDAVPCSIWPTAARARHAAFSAPMFYSAVGAYVRTDDRRFDGDLVKINDQSVTIATMDGEMSQAIAASSYPAAKTFEIPQASEITSLLLNVKSGKADVTFVEQYFAYEYMKANPGAIKKVKAARPVRVFPNTVLLPASAGEFRHKIDIGLRELRNLGAIESLLERYEPAPGIFYRVEEPYEQPEGDMELAQ